MDLSPHTSSGNGGFAAATTAGASLTPAQTPISNPATADPADDQKQNLNHVINSIQKTLGLLHQLYLTVSSFNVAAQMPLLQRLNTLVGELDTIQKLADNCNIQVPMEVLNLIDDGKNPDEFTKNVLNSCIAKNQITKGKTDAFKSMRKYLLEDLEQAFPKEVEAFREIRATSAAQSKYQERRGEREEERSGGEGKEEERGDRKRRRVERDEREEKFKNLLNFSSTPEVELLKVDFGLNEEARRLAQSQNALPNGDAKVKSEH